MASAVHVPSTSRMTSARTASVARPTRAALQRQRERDAALEQFRRIYLTVQGTDQQDLVRSIGITSATTGDGRTTIAAGIAAAMAADLERPVVLVEVDFTRPGLHRALGITPHPGICEYLRRECDLSEAVRQVSPYLFVLPAGDAAGESAKLVRQLAAADLRGRLDSSGAIIVLDLPPVLDSSFGALATSMAEALIFVVRAGKTEEEDVRDALLRLPDSAIRSLVLNDTRSDLPHWVRGLNR